MARPRTVKLPNGGEVVIKNVTPEEGDRLKKLILGQDSAPVQAPAAPPAPEADPNVYTHEALGTYQVEGLPNSFRVAVIKYNPVTRAATMLDYDGDEGPKYHAVQKFKKLAVQKKIV